jgi:predicted  nucleic acid-binding Zn-ribbon protein
MHTGFDNSSETAVAGLLQEMKFSATRSQHVIDALREAQAAERAQRMEVERSQRREEDLRTELQAMVQAQSHIADELDNAKRSLHAERAQCASLQAQLKSLHARSEEKTDALVSQQRKLQTDLSAALEHQQVLLDQLRDRDTQVHHRISRENFVILHGEFCHP